MQTVLLIRGDVPPGWQEAVRHSLQTEHGALLGKLRQEAEEQLRRAEKDREELQDELRGLQHERDQSLLQAETEKQQVRSATEHPPPFPPLVHHQIIKTSIIYYKKIKKKKIRKKAALCM